MAMQELSDEAPDDADRRFASDVARLAAAILISGIYINDAELAAMREERDRYKKIAEDGLLLTPLQTIGNLQRIL